VETLLRRSALKRLFFDTRIFDVCLVGAKLYYRAWTRWQAQRHWAHIRAHPVYGPQWRDVRPGHRRGRRALATAEPVSRA
jgi:hypothetical protein